MFACLHVLCVMASHVNFSFDEIIKFSVSVSVSVSVSICESAWPDLSYALMLCNKKCLFSFCNIFFHLFNVKHIHMKIDLKLGITVKIW